MDSLLYGYVDVFIKKGEKHGRSRYLWNLFFERLPQIRIFLGGHDVKNVPVEVLRSLIIKKIPFLGGLKFEMELMRVNWQYVVVYLS